METKFLIWQCKEGCGGLGDRLVGLVTCSIIAEITKRQFMIDWQSPDISSAVTINPLYDCKINKDLITKLPFVHEQWIDGHRKGLLSIFRESNLEDRWKEFDVIYVRNNQPFHLLLWSNPYYSSTLGDRKEVTLKHYRNIFTNYFFLTPYCLDSIQPFLKILNDDYLQTIAIHMRFGDWNFNGKRSEEDLEKATLIHSRKYAENIKSLVREKLLIPKKKVKIVLLSDAKSSLVLTCFEQVFTEELHSGSVEFYITNNKTVHLGLYITNQQMGNITDIFRDLIVMSRCYKVIFWDNTNFARISILTLGGEQEIWIYITKTNSFTKVDDITCLLTKQQLIYK